MKKDCGEGTKVEIEKDTDQQLGLPIEEDPEKDYESHKDCERRKDWLVTIEETRYRGSLNDFEGIVIPDSLWGLLMKQIQRFTQGDSSSVPVEIAESLFTSICYRLRLHMDRVGENSLEFEGNVEELFRKSEDSILLEMERGKQLLSKVKATTSKVYNISYEDTIRNVERFFEVYDYRNMAHEIPVDMDYQLSQMVPEHLLGVSYINEFLQRLLRENEFCHHFEPEVMVEVLEQYCCDYQGLLINLFEPIFTNALGLRILEQEVWKLDITKEEQGELLQYFTSRSEEEGITALVSASDSLCTILGLEDPSSMEYYRMTARSLYPRIRSAMSKRNSDNPMENTSGSDIENPSVRNVENPSIRNVEKPAKNSVESHCKNHKENPMKSSGESHCKNHKENPTKNSIESHWNKHLENPLENIFLSIHSNHNTKGKRSEFVDGIPMEDEVLRQLIVDIKECEQTVDKIQKVQEKVRSLKDLVEVLNEGFWGAEAVDLLQELGPDELTLLTDYLREVNSDWSSNSGWEMELKRWKSSTEKS